jgi:hypothetical protein
MRIDASLMKAEIVGRKFVVSGRDTPTLLDVVEEPFDQIARAEADRVFAISFGGM